MQTRANGAKYHFEFQGCDTWNSVADAKDSIKAWEKTVPDNYANKCSFAFFDATNNKELTK